MQRKIKYIKKKTREVLVNEKQLNNKEVFKGVKTCINGIDIKALEQ